MSLFSVNNAASFKRGGGNIDYTPLIKAIKVRDVEGVRRLLEVDGADPNEKDGNEKWSPMKWATYVYQYSPDRNEGDNSTRMQEIVALLSTYGAMSGYDSRTREDSYDFSPLIKEEVYDSEEEYDRTTSGGRRQRKTRKTKKTRKYRKNKTRKNVNKKRTIKRRKHMKK